MVKKPIQTILVLTGSLSWFQERTAVVGAAKCVHVHCKPK